MTRQGPPIQPPTIGRYRIEAPLGRGGMGEVFRARDERLGRAVAVKRVLRERADDSTRRRRLRREAESLARLNHPSIVQVYDWVDTADDTSWVVMELIEGETLRQELEARSEGSAPLDFDEAVGIALNLLEALAAAHRVGIVHRDVKAENVMITPSGRAKLLDFGLARIDGPLGDDGSLSDARDALGTVASMAPEQALGLGADSRSDLFSLGVLLYEMVTGVSPFRADSPVETLNRVCSWSEPPADEVNPLVPHDLSRTISELLEKEPGRRPQDAGALAERLRAGRVRGGSLTPVVAAPTGSSIAALEETVDGLPAVAESAVAGSAVAPGAPRNTQRGRRRASTRTVALAAAAVLLVVAAVAVVFAPVLGLAPTTSSRADETEPLVVAVVPPEARWTDARWTDARWTDARAADSSTHTLETLESSVEVALLRALLSKADVAGMLADVRAADVRAADVRAGDVRNGDPLEAAAALGADEVVTSRLDCAANNCRVRLDRLDASSGRVLFTHAFDAPIDRLPSLTSAVEQHALRAFAERTQRDGVPELRVSDGDYETYLRLRREWLVGREGRSTADLLREIEAIRASSPFFLEAYLLEAAVARDRHAETARVDELERSLSLLDAARRLAPADPRPLVSLATIAGDVGRLEVMEEALAALESLDPGHPELPMLQGMLLERRGDGKGALRAIERSVERRPSQSNLFALAQTQYRQGDWRAARLTLGDLLERFPGHSRARSFLAQIELANGDPRRAAELYERLYQKTGRVADLANLGLAYLLLQRHDDAVRAFERVVEEQPGNAFLLLNLADATQLRGDRELAERRYRDVLRLLEEDDGASWQALSVRAQALAHLGESRDAVAAVQGALRESPDHPQTLYEASLVYALVGEDFSAMVHAERALRHGIEPRWYDFAWFDRLRTRPELTVWLDGDAVG